jgi:hypothetical protein
VQVLQEHTVIHEALVAKHENSVLLHEDSLAAAHQDLQTQVRSLEKSLNSRPSAPRRFDLTPTDRRTTLREGAKQMSSLSFTPLPVAPPSRGSRRPVSEQRSTPPSNASSGHSTPLGDGQRSRAVPEPEKLQHSGWLVRESTVTARRVLGYYIGTDICGVPVVALYYPEEDPEFASLWQILDELRKNDTWLWLSTRPWAILVDDDVTEEQLRDFENAAVLGWQPLQECGLFLSQYDDDSLSESDSGSSHPGPRTPQAVKWTLPHREALLSRYLPNSGSPTAPKTPVTINLTRGSPPVQVSGTLVDTVGDVLLVRCDLKKPHPTPKHLLALAQQLQPPVPPPASPASYVISPLPATAPTGLPPPNPGLPGAPAATLSPSPASRPTPPNITPISGSVVTGTPPGITHSYASNSAVTQDDARTISGLKELLRKSKLFVSASWRGKDLATDEVQSILLQLQDHILSTIRKASPPLTEAGVAYMVLQILRPSTHVHKLVGTEFATNAADEAVGFQDPSLTADDWLNRVFYRLTGINYDKRGRERRLAPLDLANHWPFGLAGDLVDDFISVQSEGELVIKTWAEIWAIVRLLLDSTGFASVLGLDIQPRIQACYRGSIQAGGAKFWPQVRTHVVNRLEGPDGVYSDWATYKMHLKDPALGTYMGQHRVAFDKIAWEDRPANKAALTSPPYRNRSNIPRQVIGGGGGPTARVNVFAAPPEYHSKEEADKVKWEPCPFHIDKILKDPNNTLTREEIAANMHASCTCLNLHDPWLYNTIHPGGPEELLRRRDLRENERKQVWNDQREVVETLRRTQQPEVDGLNLITEHEEGSLCLYINSGDGTQLYTLNDAEPSCV